MKSAIVVGGGVSGILSALLLSKKCSEVYLVERAPQLGGLLSSVYSPEGDSFDHGTHYLVNTGHEPIDSLLFPENWKREWMYLPFLKAGNYFQGKLNERCMYPDTNLLPLDVYQQGVRELLAIKDEPHKSRNLEEHLNGVFGETFTKAVFEPIVHSRLGLPLQELYINAHTIINLTRILAFDEEVTRKLKKESSIFDQKIGFHSYTEGVRVTQSYYPKAGGTGEWIGRLEERLNKAGVKVLKNKAIKSIQHQSGLVESVTFDSGEGLSCDAIFWTLPVPALLKLAGMTSLVAPPKIRITSHFHFVFDRPPNTDLYYFLCHDAKKLSFRVTFYSNIQIETSEARGRYCVSVETLSGAVENVDEMADRVLLELIEMKVISEDAKVLWRRASSGVAGVPVVTPKYVEQTQQQMEEIGGRLKNAYFLGMIPGVSFFKKEVLTQSYEQISSLL